MNDNKTPDNWISGDNWIKQQLDALRKDIAELKDLSVTEGINAERLALVEKLKQLRAKTDIEITVDYGDDLNPVERRYIHHAIQNIYDEVIDYVLGRISNDRKGTN